MQSLIENAGYDKADDLRYYWRRHLFLTQRFKGNTMKKIFLTLLMCTSTMVLSHHHGKDQHALKDYKGSGKLNLSADLRVMLNQEMQLLKGGMESLVLSTVSGKWGKIATIGQQIKQSYILSQKLSSEQHQQLAEQLPPGFKSLDDKLHHYAGMLAHVAQQQDIELVNFYIYKINETCSSCHSRFARDKFEGFRQPPVAGHH
jgi:hypothetical protein